MRCDNCGKKVYSIYITRKYEKLCYDCYSKVRPKERWKLEDIPLKERLY